jgi:hypothetical protein
MPRGVTQWRHVELPPRRLLLSKSLVADKEQAHRAMRPVLIARSRL